MRYTHLLPCVLALASVVTAQTQQSSPPAPGKAAAAEPAAQPAKPAGEGPAVDEAKVTGSTFQSTFFKFTYEFAKGLEGIG